MGDFFLDDAFFDHPKALHAGEDASNLYVRALAWAHKHNTGHVPKNALPTLTTKRNPDSLAKKLCEVVHGYDNPLWFDRGDSYEIHDWYVRNAKMRAKRQQAKAAAEASWRARRERERSGKAADAHAE